MGRPERAPVHAAAGCVELAKLTWPAHMRELKSEPNSIVALL